jgi:hypothetical protein
MNISILPPYSSLHDLEISSIAYRLWKEAKQPSGRFVEYWMRAEILTEASDRENLGAAPRPNGPPCNGLVSHERKVSQVFGEDPGFA